MKALIKYTPHITRRAMNAKVTAFKNPILSAAVGTNNARNMTVNMAVKAIQNLL
jgi:hypothetical protein